MVQDEIIVNLASSLQDLMQEYSGKWVLSEDGTRVLCSANSKKVVLSWPVSTDQHPILCRVPGDSSSTDITREL